MTASEQREKDLEKALKLYKDRVTGEYRRNAGCKFEEYDIFWGMTNECLQDLWERLCLAGDTGLSVLASGDQMLNLIYKGASKIDTFDINRLTEYYAIGFKKRAIECLNYEQFVKLFNYYEDKCLKDSYNLNPELEKYVIENMEDEYRRFWQEFLYRSKELTPNGLNSIFALAEKNEFKIVKDAKTNIYMGSQENYRKLQQNLLTAKITYSPMDVLNVTPDIGKYDIIFLSNIFDYYEDMFGLCSFAEAFKVVKNIYDYNLNEGGQLIFTKLFSRFVDLLMINESVKDKRLYTNNCCDAYGWEKPRSRKR